MCLYANQRYPHLSGPEILRGRTTLCIIGRVKIEAGLLALRDAPERENFNK